MLHPVVSVALANWSKGYFLATPWKSCTSIVTFKLLYEKQKNLAELFFALLVPYPHLPGYLRMLVFSILNAWFLFSVYPKVCQ